MKKFKFVKYSHLILATIANISWIFFNVFYFMVAKSYYLQSTTSTSSAIWMTVRLLQIGIFFTSFLIIHWPIKKLANYKDKVEKEANQEVETKKILERFNSIIKQQNPNQGFENAKNITSKVKRVK